MEASADEVVRDCMWSCRQRRAALVCTKEGYGGACERRDESFTVGGRSLACPEGCMLGSDADMCRGRAQRKRDDPHWDGERSRRQGVWSIEEGYGEDAGISPAGKRHIYMCRDDIIAEEDGR